MSYRSLVLVLVLVIAGACTVSSTDDMFDIAAEANSPVDLAEPSDVTEAPGVVGEALDAGVAVVDPAIAEFLAEPELNALGEPMILVLETTRAIPPGTRVSELLANPSRYLEILAIDPSETSYGSTDFAADAASFAWLRQRPNMILETGVDSAGSTLWKFYIVVEEFVPVLVSSGPIPDGTSFASILEDLEGWTRTELRPIWQVRQEHWLAATRGPLTAAELADFSECRIERDLSDGDPIVFQGAWYLGRQQLQVTDTIPVGLTVAQLVAAPTRYLSAHIDRGCGERTLHSVAELVELQGQVAIRDIEVGTNLDVSQFGQPSELPVGVSALPTPAPPTPAPTSTAVSVSLVEVYVAVQDLPVGLTMEQVLQDPGSYLRVIEIDQIAAVENAVGPINGAVRQGEPYSMIDHFLSRCVVAEFIAAGDQLLLPRTWLQRIYVSRAVAAGTTVAEITQGLTEAEADIRLRGQADACGVEDDDYLVDMDQVRALDPTLVLNRVITAEDPLQFSFFSEPG